MLQRRARNLSLKWKIIIPFLFFAFSGTTLLTYIGLSSQQALIRAEEEREIYRYYNLFQEEIEDKKGLVLSLATTIAEDLSVQQLLADRDRERLYQHMVSTFIRLKRDFQVEQIHFHIPPGVSFLRVHRPRMVGDELLRDRELVADAMRDQEPRAGLEMGRTGYSIRGVVPVFDGTTLVGTVEVGHSFGTPFLHHLQKRWGMDLSLYSIDEEGAWSAVAQSRLNEERTFLDPSLARQAVVQPLFLVEPVDRDRAFLLFPVWDYSGDLMAILQLSMDRSDTNLRLTETRNIMILIGVIGIVTSFLLTYLVALLLIRPIEAIVREAQEIAEEKRERHIGPRPGDEIGRLTDALNLMLDALLAKRRELEEHARTLERRVEERTADLVASEEKYRTLVEHVPLIVYRILRDGTTEFVNSYLTEILGYSIEEAVGRRGFWFEKIWRCPGAESEELWKKSFETGEGYRVERVVRDRQGRPLTFIDHAIPTRDSRGDVQWVDGIMMDITELKAFQDLALRSEEIRLLEEISAHMAHAIRNPLSSAGGFARRLQNGLPGNDPNRRLAEIIVKEVARIEDFLKVLFSSIRPFELSLGEVDVNQILQSLVARLEGSLKAREIDVEEAFSLKLPRIQADDERLGEAFESILKHASILTPAGETLRLSTALSGDRIVITLSHRAIPLSQDDLDKFFFPHIEKTAQWPIIDLSLSRRIIHRHRGKIDIVRQEDDCLLVKIELPVRVGN
jgi:PAS domain S-box-containing protein